MRILHLSDFHFSERRAWDQDPVLRGLVKDVEGFVKTGLAPDVVAVTGDIADRGLPAEYAIAERWLRECLLPATGITGDRLLFVPGNHDVDRGAVKKVALAAQDSLLRDQDQETIAAVLGDPDERGLLLRRHAAWIAFANRFRAEPLDLPWWSADLELRGMKLHVAGFCSSWMSSSDNDKGHLLLGRWQVHALLAGADEADLSVALMHHPFDYLADFDVEEAREAIQRSCAIVLSGHRHRQIGQAATRPSGVVLELAAGCCYGGSDYANAFQLLEVEPAAGPVRVHLRIWDGHEWIVDRNAYGGAVPDGIAKFALQGGRLLGVERENVGKGGAASIETSAGAVFLGDIEAQPLLSAYYRSLADECRRLPLGVIDTQFVRTANEASIPLPDIYVDLDVVAPAAPASEEGERAWALRLLRPEGTARQPILTALAAPEGARAVLLGDAGSGKSTLVSYLAYLLATDSPELPATLRGRLVLRLVLREVAARHIPAGSKSGEAEMLWDALREDISRRVGKEAAGRLASYLQGRLLKDGGVFLLDGLDEVPEAERRREVVLGAIRALAATLPDAARLLVTARPYAYAEKKWHLPGFPILALAPFSPEQVERFIERWYRAARQPMGWSEETAGTKGGQLRDALRDRPYLGDLASRPLLLTLMATLHSSWGQLPDDRAQLFEEVVKLLLGRWQRAREVSGPTGEAVIEPGISQALSVGDERIREALERLALEVHERQRGQRQREGPADISEGEVLVAFKPLLGEVNPEVLLAYLRDRAGLLVAPREGVYAFPHRSFQEYLAACRLANAPDAAARLRDKAIEDADWWREAFLLGVGKIRQGGLGNAAQVVNVLLPQAATEVEDRKDLRLRLAVLAGQALLELRLAEKAPGEQHYQALLKRTRGWLVVAVEEDRLVPGERLQAGDILGRLGDPRFDAEVFHLPKRYRDAPEPLFGFVEVPAGPFTMGSLEDDELANDEEHPAHTLDLASFHIGRYPVTNAQYQCFIESGGYEAREHWTEEGWAWRQGADADLGPIDHKDFRRQVADWLANRPAAKRSKPYFWDQPPGNAMTRPVVGVSWYEALAYCRWLTEKLNGALRKGALAPGERYLVRLPTEAEWEKAARGTGARSWPWGDAWQESSANTSEAKLEQTSPVGLFLAGASPCGTLDMAGNVGEWTSSRWGRTTILKPDYGYPYRPDDGREGPDGPDLRVMRGGSWFSSHQSARCAYRVRNFPVYFGSGLGFRAVLSLANSES